MNCDIGWADKFGAALAGRDEEEKAKATGLPVIKRWRVNHEARMKSAQRGGRKGGPARSAKRKLAAL